VDEGSGSSANCDERRIEEEQGILLAGPTRGPKRRWSHSPAWLGRLNERNGWGGVSLVNNKSDCVMYQMYGYGARGNSQKQQGRTMVRTVQRSSTAAGGNIQGHSAGKRLRTANGTVKPTTRDALMGEYPSRSTVSLHDKVKSRRRSQGNDTGIKGSTKPQFNVCGKEADRNRDRWEAKGEMGSRGSPKAVQGFLQVHG